MTEAGWTRERKLVEELLTFIEAVSGRLAHEDFHKQYRQGMEG